ncbi:MAG TPA: hypothetical protein PLX84_11100 [Acidiphilium sp.]|nr:hypothetical protein [Acidiphilium sp.]
MEFGDNVPLSRNKAIGIGMVIVLHVFLVYALVSGLATSAVDLIKKPLEIKIVKASPPPPPPPPAAPPPVLSAPPPPYIPPPIVQIQQPPRQKPVFAVTSSAKPTAPTTIKPAPAPAPAKPHPVSIGVVCPNIGRVAQALSNAFQRISDSEGINRASVVVEFSVTTSGGVANPHVVSSTFPGINRLALQGIGMLSCRGQGQTVTVRAPFEFRAN